MALVSRTGCMSNSRCEIGASLGINQAAIDVHAGVTGLARFPGSNLSPRFDTTFNRIHGVAMRFTQRFSPRHAAANRKHLRGKHSVFVVEIIDGVFLITFHAANLMAGPSSSKRHVHQHTYHAGITPPTSLSGHGTAAEDTFLARFGDPLALQLQMMRTEETLDFLGRVTV